MLETKGALENTIKEHKESVKKARGIESRINVSVQYNVASMTDLFFVLCYMSGFDLEARRCPTHLGCDGRTEENVGGEAD